MTRNTDTTQIKPRRSCLYMPGVNARALDKARTLPADVIIMDLEDSVAPEAKTEAREQVAREISKGGYDQREIVVRCNGQDTQWFDDDLNIACKSGTNAVLVPKVNCAEEVRAISSKMDALGAPERISLWVMIESPLAVLNVADIAAAASDTRLSALVLGFNDLAKEMRGKPDSARKIFIPTLSATIMAARAHGICAIDSVFNDFKDMDGLTRECQQAVNFGFDGKTLIHPAQIETANAAFAPSPSEITEAEAIIAAFALPENSGKGVITVDGKMTELLHLEQAKQTVAMAKAISERAA